MTTTIRLKEIAPRAWASRLVLSTIPEHHWDPVLNAWQQLIARPALAPVTSRSLFLHFDGRANPVPFTEMSYAFHAFILGQRLATLWYAPPVGLRTVWHAPETLRMFSASTWQLTEMDVADLAPLLLTPWAEAHLWPDAMLFTDAPASLYNALIDGPSLVAGLPSAPIVIFDGAVHSNSIAYGLALLRFASPHARVTVIRGGGAAIPLAEPEGRYAPDAIPGPIVIPDFLTPPPCALSEWIADGTEQRRYVDGLTLDTAAEADAYQARKSIIQDRARIGQRWWNGRTDHLTDAERAIVMGELAQLATDENQGSANFPRVFQRHWQDASWVGAPSLADQAAWTPPAPQLWPSNMFTRIEAAIVGRLPFSAAPLAEQIYRCEEAVALEVAMVALEASPLLALLPELQDEYERMVVQRQHHHRFGTEAQRTAARAANIVSQAALIARYPLSSDV